MRRGVAGLLLWIEHSHRHVHGSSPWFVALLFFWVMACENRGLIRNNKEQCVTMHGTNCSEATIRGPATP
jgi:hypothetical protein